MDQAFLQRIQTVKPKLSTKARLQTDKVSGEPVLLYPEGVVLLNASSVAITRLCDGTHSFPEILAKLAEQYNVQASQIEGDVGEFIFNLHQQSLVELEGYQEQEP